MGDAISLTVTFTDGEGFSESLTSAATYAAVASGATHKLLWLGTMEVGSVPGEDLFGYTGGGALVWDHGSLSVTKLSVAGVEYTVGSVVNETGTSDLALSIYLSPAFPGPFTLHIGSVDTEFASQDASEGDVAGYQLYSWSNTNLGWSDGQKVTIFLQEKPGVILTPSTLTVAEGGTADYTVELSSEPTADVTVDITGGGDLTVNPNSLTFTSATWDTAKTVTVTAAQDDDGADDTRTVGPRRGQRQRRRVPRGHPRRAGRDGHRRRDPRRDAHAHDADGERGEHGGLHGGAQTSSPPST